MDITEGLADGAVMELSAPDAVPLRREMFFYFKLIKAAFLCIFCRAPLFWTF